MVINRTWAMPNKNTFDIKPIKELIERYHTKEMVSIDPFANKNRIANITNDLDTQYDTNYHLDALEFLGQYEKGDKPNNQKGWHCYIICLE